jgi:hypothetical protein
MPLKLRPTDLGSGIDKDRLDYTILWRIGCGPHLPDPRRPRQFALDLVAYRQRSDDTPNRVATLKEAKVQCRVAANDLSGATA